MDDARAAFLHAFAAIFKKRRKARALKPVSSLRLKHNENLYNVLRRDPSDEDASEVVRAGGDAERFPQLRPLVFLR